MFNVYFSVIWNGKRSNPNINKQTNDDDALLEVLMLLMTVINPRECLFRNGKHCCFCVCSYRVDVRMSAASGGKFCVNIFCFQDPPPHCVVFTFRLLLQQETCCFKVQILRVQHVLLGLDAISVANLCAFSVFECVLQIYYHGRQIVRSDIICALCQDVNNILLPTCFC